MSCFQKIIIAFVFVCTAGSGLRSQILSKNWKDIIATDDKAWFSSKEAQEIAENVLLYQRNIGGWPKNIQMQKTLFLFFKPNFPCVKSLFVCNDFRLT